MADVIMDYDMMRAMNSAFVNASNALDDIESGLSSVQGMIDGGALVGKGGQKLQELIESGIIPFTKQINGKLNELAGDVNGARAFMEEGDTTAASRFK